MYSVGTLCAWSASLDASIFIVYHVREMRELATIAQQVSETQQVLAWLRGETNVQEGLERSARLLLEEAHNGLAHGTQQTRSSIFWLDASRVSVEERCRSVQWLENAWEVICEHEGQTTEVRTRRRKIADLKEYTKPWKDRGLFERGHQFAGKACIALAAPQCIFSIAGYAADTGITKSRLKHWLSGPFNPWLLTGEQQSHPSALLFFGATMALTLLETLYFQANIHDNYQVHALFLATGVAFLLGQQADLSLLASCLCEVPWCIYWSLLLSDFCHFAARRRSRGQPSTRGTEKENLLVRDVPQDGEKAPVSMA